MLENCHVVEFGVAEIPILTDAADGELFGKIEGSRDAEFRLKIFEAGGCRRGLMRRVVLLVIAMLFMVSFSAPIATAQLIDWSKRHAREVRPSVGNNPPNKSAKEKYPVTAGKSAAGSADPLAKTREDRLFDLNGDGRLQAHEIREMLKSVAEEVANNGKMEVLSDVIQPYDKDRDGYIDRKEVMAITRELQK